MHPAAKKFDWDVHRRKAEDFSRRCTVSTLQNSIGLVVVLRIYAISPGPSVRFQGRIKASKYIDMFCEHFLLYFDPSLSMKDNDSIQIDNSRGSMKSM